MQMSNTNPLMKHFRQPKLYINLPSRGAFYPTGAIETTEDGNYPVLAMTAKDEIMMKTPDALLNGQSTVNVIQSCMPNIKNAWMVPSIDIDAILIAIRIATYGETMEITSHIPQLEDERTFETNLRSQLDSLCANEYSAIFSKGDFTFEVHPLNYKTFTETALKTFEEQRLFTIVNDDDMSEAEKLSKFSESFAKLTDINITQVFSSVKAIKFQQEDPVVDANHIQEFLSNADAEIYKGLIQHVDDQRKKFSMQPLKATFSDEDMANGAPDNFEIPITFDQSNFFA